METIWQELTNGLHDPRMLTRMVIRLAAATLLGSIIGIQRQRWGKPAGLRTHMLVSLGTCVFVLACSSVGMSLDGQSRVIQGIVTGIGFLGAGSILKLGAEHDIKGLTTAAGVWVTAAIGVTAGLGALGVALLATALALIIFELERFENKRKDKRSADR